MSTKEVTAIVLRLFSIWLLVQVILNISSVALLLTNIGQYQGEVIPDYVYFMLIGSFIAIGLLAAYFIWASAKSALERSEEHTSELQSRFDLVCRLLLEKKKEKKEQNIRFKKKATRYIDHD